MKNKRNLMFTAQRRALPLPLVARPAARAAAVAAAVLLAAGSAAGQTSPITNNTTINSQVSFASRLIVGSSSSPGPTLTINSGANISIGGTVEPFYVGTNSNPFATVIQNGGSVTVDGTVSSALVLGQNTSANSANTQYTGSASYTLNSGSLTLGAIGDTTAGGYLSIGRSSNAAFTQTGGTITAYREDAVLVMGLVNNGTGSYEISGGTFEGIGLTGSTAGLRIAERASLSGGQGTLTISGGTVAIEQGNTWLTREGSSTATVNLTAGTLALNGNVTRGVPNSGNAPGTVAFTLGGGTLRPYDENLVVGPTTAANTAAFNITLASSTTSTITGVGWKTGSIHAVTMDTPLIGTGNIDFAGGTVTLAAANTYSGITTVQAGTLALSSTGSFNSSTTIDVKSGATFDVTAKSGFTVGASQTLKGSGTIKGATTINGILAPGASPGTLTFENALTLANSTVMEIDGTAGAGVVGGHDFVNLSGAALTYGGTMTLDIGTIFGAGTYSWNLFDFASETSGFSGITLADQYSGSLTGSGDSWGLTSGNNTWSFAESTGVLGLTVIPEPGAALLGSLGLLALLRRRR